MRNPVLPYQQELRNRSRQLRKEGTLGEVLVWRRLRARQLRVQFHRQVPIGSYIVDFYCHELRLAIEIDGYNHRVDYIGKYDLQRQRDLELRGVRLLRFEEGEVRKDLDGVIDAISGCVAEMTERTDGGSENTPRSAIADHPPQGGT